ncbi:MAG: glycosyltransferase [Nanoarchaeota archaeon]|nr:glycosyltransferase [Nanoarchaeota archaeon]MBU1005517.1 glycosyltransferase [Nanoarchaeota archaeon]MBU1945856.1 glycosyltransferase [Nanoarchaeota archaeon]
MSEFKMFFSVIIPTSNEQKYIGKLLNSLKKQTFKDFEVIIVDANSKDKTKSIAYKFKNCFKKFKFIVEKRKGVSLARNVGAKASKGDVLVFFDSDGETDPNFFEIAAKQIKKRKIDTSGCYVKPITQNIAIKQFFVLYNFWIFLSQYFYPHMPGFCIFCDRKTFFKLGGFDETILLAEDFDLVNRSKKVGKFRVLNKIRIKSSMRRFEEEGTWKLTTKYMNVFFYRIFKGEVRTDKFKYGLGYHKK